MATVAPIVRRAVLYVPASSRKFLDKSRALQVDSVAYDLEDSVTPGRKVEARQSLRNFLEQPRSEGIRETSVRINAVDSGLALDDLTEILKAPNLDAILIPKVNSASDMHFVTDVLRHISPTRHPSNPSMPTEKAPIRLLALIESAKSVLNLSEICKASPYLSGLVFAAEDFALDLSLTRTTALTEFLFARSTIATAARAYDLPSTIDLVCTAFRGEQGQRTLEEECLSGRGLGFNGKQCIHPTQVEVCQRTFAPSLEEVEWAVRVVIADEKAETQGRGAWTLDGKMIDVPVVGKAKAIVGKAKLSGFNIDELRKKWRDQEPE